ncbi:3-oxoacyl-ACP synthase III family protein [Rhodococcus sp. NPDC003348]
MKTVSLVDVASYLPENRVGADYFAQFSKPSRLANSPMFRPPAYRHHVADGESAVDMAWRAVTPLRERSGDDAMRAVDVVLTHTQLPDLPVQGCAGELAYRLGANPDWVLDVHNSGCAAFPYMIRVAEQLLQRDGLRSALVVAIQNAAGQVFTQTTVRSQPQAAIPGDGCGAGLLVVDDRAPVLATACRSQGEFAPSPADADVDPPRKYWEPGEGQFRIAFDQNKIARVYARGNRMVPEVAQDVCRQLGVAPDAVDVFVTNQPNRLFLRNWREAMQLPVERHPDTFDECGNLFAAGIPVTLDTENRAGRIPNGALVVMAAFAHAGDFAGAAAVRWGAAPA